MQVTNSAEQIQSFTTCLFQPGDLIEVRRLPNGKSTWHLAGELHEQADALTTENEARQNIHIGVNPRSYEGRGTAAVGVCNAMYADFDDTTVEDALERVERADMPTPTLTVDSGHG